MSLFVHRRNKIINAIFHVHLFKCWAQLWNVTRFLQYYREKLKHKKPFMIGHIWWGKKTVSDSIEKSHPIILYWFYFIFSLIMKLYRAKDEMLKVLCLLYSQKIFREFKFNKNLRLTYLRKTLNAYFFNAIWLAWPFTPNKIMILNMIRFDAGTKSLKKTSLYPNIKIII